MDRLRDAFHEAVEPDALLLIGRCHVRSNNSWMHNLNVLTKGKDRCTMLVHPQDASSRGLESGDVAEVSKRTGTLEIAVEVTEPIMQGVVSIPQGWGHQLEHTMLKIANLHAGHNTNTELQKHSEEVKKG